MMDQSHQLIKIFYGSKMMEHQHHVNNGKCTESQVHISQSNFLYIKFFENFIKPKIMLMFSFLLHNFHESMAKELKLSLLLELSMLKDLNWSGPKIQT